MGPDYLANAIISPFETGDAAARRRAAILRNARPFREAATVVGQAGWTTYAPPPQAPAVVRH